LNFTFASLLLKYKIIFEMSSNKNPQLSIFEEHKTKSAIVKISGRVLSKEQKQFNSLIEDLKRAGNELELLKKELPKYFSELLEISKPLEQEMLELNYSLIKASDRYLREMKLTKNQRTTVMDYVLFKIRELPVEPPEDIKKIYDVHSEVGFDEEAEAGIDAINNQMSKMMEAMFGIKVDTDFDPNLSEFEKVERLKSKLEETGFADFAQNRLFDFDNGPGNERKKSKKEIKADETRRIQQEKEDVLRKKSFKSIYMDLMKAFHPDTESDPLLKAEKEEISKLITVAYGNEDFFGLLKLEAEYLSQNDNRIQTLPKDQLQYYMKMLGNQKAELKYQKDELIEKYDVVYQGIYKKRMSRQDFFERYKSDFEEQLKYEKFKIDNLLSKNMAHRKIVVDGMEYEMDEGLEFDIFDF